MPISINQLCFVLFVVEEIESKEKVEDFFL